jgi:hypothetical protein
MVTQQCFSTGHNSVLGCGLAGPKNVAEAREKPSFAVTEVKCERRTPNRIGFIRGFWNGTAGCMVDGAK